VIWFLPKGGGGRGSRGKNVAGGGATSDETEGMEIPIHNCHKGDCFLGPLGQCVSGQPRSNDGVSVPGQRDNSPQGGHPGMHNFHSVFGSWVNVRGRGPEAGKKECRLRHHCKQPHQKEDPGNLWGSRDQRRAKAGETP